MPPNPPSHPQSLSAARERTVKLLGDAFAADAFEMDELETRLARVYQATSIAELDAMVQDLAPQVADQAPVPRVAAGETVAPSSVRALMSSTRRGGRWILPARLETRAIMSELTLDLRDAELPPGGCELHVRAVMSNVVILLRPGTPVSVDVRTLMSNVDDQARYAGRVDRNATPVRVTGSALMSNVEVRAVAMQNASDDTAND